MLTSDQVSGTNKPGFVRRFDSSGKKKRTEHTIVKDRRIDAKASMFQRLRRDQVDEVKIPRNWK
jgi:hypothetical protein